MDELLKDLEWLANKYKEGPTRTHVGVSAIVYTVACAAAGEEKGFGELCDVVFEFAKKQHERLSKKP